MKENQHKVLRDNIYLNHKCKGDPVGFHNGLILNDKISENKFYSFTDNVNIRKCL